MDFSTFSNQDLLLNHTVVHTVFAIDKKKKGNAKKIHNKIVIEMQKRGQPYQKYDKLDKL